MAKRKPLKSTKQVVDEAIRHIEKDIDEKYLDEARKITGKLWAEMIVMGLMRLGWNSTKLAKELGVSATAIRQWRDADREPNPRNKKKLMTFWDAELTKIAKEAKR